MVPEPAEPEGGDVSATVTEELASDTEAIPATANAPFSSAETTGETTAELEESETPAQAIVPPAREPEEPVVEPTAQPADVVAATPTISASPVSASSILADDKAPNSLGEVFGQPGKASWAPGEIVQEVVKLPQIAGAIVALSEGLVVAHRLPEGMKGEVVAAFLPQIFGRLNQYCTEMKVGEIDEILLSSGGAYFQAFHSGQIFFAVLGKQGESLPWHALRLMAEELLQQTKK